MPFVKVVKNKAYFKRFQVKFRRRRNGQTDYRQRHKLIVQDKNKYQLPKYRLVVRFSNKYVSVQVIKAEIIGDKVLCAASSRELSHHGLEVGLKNYAAAYCTGLLCARRLLQKLGLDEIYPGVEDITGEVITCEGDNGKKYFVESLDEDESNPKKPFRCFLDVGIRNTTTGSRVFAAMKGASDGGLDIPHSNKRFPGYSRDTKTYDAEVMKGHIMGEHIADYMREMEEDDEENYQKHFAKFIAADKDADDLEELYESVHASIRKDPSRREGEKYVCTDKTTYKKSVKKTYEQRKVDSNAKKASLRAGLAGGDDEEEEDAEDDE